MKLQYDLYIFPQTVIGIDPWKNTTIQNIASKMAIASERSRGILLLLSTIIASMPSLVEGIQVCK